jgi:hypothetical protein
MAKRLSFPTRKPKSTRKRSPFSGTTFVQRSRNESSEQKAIWHNVTGAGRSHVRREFFDLTDDERQAAKDALEGLIDQRLHGREGIGR